jgi:hypothetical protein
LGYVPRTFGDIPETLGDIPGTLGDIPGTLGDIPETPVDGNSVFRLILFQVENRRRRAVAGAFYFILKNRAGREKNRGDRLPVSASVAPFSHNSYFLKYNLITCLTKI